jgi:2-iminobutanoate/2-iminopropanoate deaminase
VARPVVLESLNHIAPADLFGRNLPLSPAVRVGRLVFVSGIPPFGEHGTIAIGSFTAQMRQVMENATQVLRAAGADWDRVVKTNVLLTRHQDFAEMNRIYSGYFQNGRYPARTTAIVASLPHRDFLIEIDCQAVLDEGAFGR